ncbi:MAG: shikimate kinase [Planctomycetota bacterium]
MSLPPLILVGMPGTGKTHWGRRLASMHEVPFTDLDAWVEQKSGTSPSTFLTSGRAVEFRHWEAAGLRAWLEKPDGILATGGGTPLVPDCLSVLLRFPRVLLLISPPEVRLDRMQESPRPLLTGANPASLQARLEAERGLVYSAVAKAVVDTSGAQHDVEQRLLDILASMSNGAFRAPTP